VANNWQVHGKNSILVIWDANGASRNVSGDMNSITATWTRDNTDSTTFGQDSIQRVPGIYDYKLTGGAIFSGADTSGIDAVMAGIMAASLNTLVQYLPAGSRSGSPVYTACMLVDQWELSGEVKSTVAATWSFSLASGSLTVGSAV